MGQHINPRSITLDGVGGAGKSINPAVMKQWFEARRLLVLFTREPGDIPTGEALREILFNPEAKAGLCIETLLTFAARQQHLEGATLSALKNGIRVASDRFTDVTFAYRGGGRDVPLQDIETLEDWVQGSFRPNLTLPLDVPLEVPLERTDRIHEKGRFEREQADFFTRVCNTYLSRTAMNPERYAVINGNRSPEAVRAGIEVALEAHFGFIRQVV